MWEDSRLARSVEWRTTLVLVILSLVVVGHSTIVQTKFGRIRGIQNRSTKGRPTTYYLGVPYAEPPIGDLRFKSPQPWTRKWNVTYDAIVDGNKCVQPDQQGNIVGSEDCLYLNIFIPTLTDKPKRTEKLPVLVYVHGGKYIFGSSDSRKWSPEHLMDQNVVFVTINYRLSIMGFFSTENKLAPGNYGLKDIVMALRWVQKNIEAFHGDPNSVTLWGHSAGAGAVHTLAFSKNTEGLFHRYIIMSGSIFAPWNTNPKGWIRRTSLVAAENLGCLPRETGNSVAGLRDEECPAEDRFCKLYGPTKDINFNETEEMLSCMRSLDANTIGGVLKHFDIWRGNPECPYGPVIEEESEEAVLTADPFTTMEKRQFRDLPRIVGAVRDEGLAHKSHMKETLDELKDNFEEYILILTQYHKRVSDSHRYAEAIKEFYFGSNFSRYCWDNASQAGGDSEMIFPVYQAARLQSPVMSSSTFFYFFTYEGTFSRTLSYDTLLYRPIVHSDELEYLMPSQKFASLRRTEDDVIMSNLMTELWTSFAATGVPEASGTIPWPDYKRSDQYLVLGKGNQSDITVDDNFLPARMAFWMKVNNADGIQDEEAKPQQPPEDIADSSSAQGYSLLVLLSILLIVYL